MKSRKIVLILLTVLLTLSLVVGCGSEQDKKDTTDGESSDSGTGTDEDIHISVIFKALSHEYWKTMGEGCEQAASDLGIEVTVLGPNAESEIAQQVTQIEEQIASDTDAIVVAPTEESAAIGALTPAVGKIPVLLVDTDANLEAKTAFIGTGNENAAKLGGDFVAEQLKGKGNAVLIGGQQGEGTSEQRLNGFRKGLEEGGITVLEEQFGMNTSDKALAVMEDLLTKYPGEIDAVLTMNDDMAYGVLQACENSGYEDIIVIGFNADTQALEYVAEGKMAATIAQQPYQMGYQCVEQAYKAIKGEAIEKHQDVPAELVTKENVADYR